MSLFVRNAYRLHVTVDAMLLLSANYIYNIISLI